MTTGDQRPAFAVIRFDDFSSEPLSSSNVEDRVTVQRVWATEQQAESEAARLNALVQERGQTGVRYFMQYTRMDLADEDQS